MRQQGHIKDWKDDKGFGFVAPLSAGAETAFVHINSFLNRRRRPVNGDLISYEAVQDFQKRWQAQAIRYVDEQPKEVPVLAVGTWSPASNGGSRSALPLLRVLLVLLVLGILGLLGFQWLQSNPVQRAGSVQPLADPIGTDSKAPMVSDSSPYRCDGRTRCPQMHSCEEANWFVANCPNTEMDGDGDGVACERQWCASEG